MKIPKTLLLLVLLLTAVFLPVPDTVGGAAYATEHQVAAPPLRSLKLDALNAKFLEPGNETAFWEEVQHLAEAGDYPFVEDIEQPTQSPPDYVLVTFLHRQGDSPPENVFLLANINHVVPAELLFERIGQTNVYFKTVEVPRGVRFLYRIIENDPLTGLFAAAKYGTRAHVLGADPDPLNPTRRVIPNAFGEGRHFTVTWVELEGASPQPYIADKGNPRGTLGMEQHESTTLGYARRIITYLPPDHDPDKEYPLLILFDGAGYFSLGGLNVTLDNLIAEKSIPPLIVLGIDPGSKDGQNLRNVEYTCNPQFLKYLDEELLPWFMSNHKVSSDPGQRIIAGSSFGGLFATYFAFNRPETVSNVLSQSGSFHWGRDEDEFQYEWLIREFAFKDKKPISLYLEAGVLEGEYSWTYPHYPHQIASHRHFKTVLDMKGYNVTYVEYGGGHDMLSWRGGIADGLKHYFGSKEPE